jgi:hypothetical protein
VKDPARPAFRGRRPSPRPSPLSALGCAQARGHRCGDVHYGSVGLAKLIVAGWLPRHPDDFYTSAQIGAAISDLIEHGDLPRHSRSIGDEGTMAQAIALTRSGGELAMTTEGDLPSVISTLARDLQAATKNMDDTTIELDFASDNGGQTRELPGSGAFLLHVRWPYTKTRCARPIRSSMSDHAHL